MATLATEVPGVDPPPAHPDHFGARVVSSNGAFFFRHPKPTFISVSFAGKCLGFEQAEHGRVTHVPRLHTGKN